MITVDGADVTLLAAWCVTTGLLLAGLIGCIIPFLPGHWLLLLAAVAHRLMLGSEASSLRWWSFAVLLALMAISQVIEILSGAAGSRWFGGSGWGIAGALLGTLAGMFFLPFGLLLGPLLGAFLAEILAGRDSASAMRSGLGSSLGVLAGMAARIISGLLMTVWFLLDALAF